MGNTVTFTNNPTTFGTNMSDIVVAVGAVIVQSGIAAKALTGPLAQLSLTHLFPNFAFAACTVAAFYGSTRGFKKWCRVSTCEYKLKDDDNILTEILNGCVSSAVFTAYTIGAAAVSAFFVDNILVAGPAYGAYLYYRGQST